MGQDQATQKTIGWQFRETVLQWLPTMFSFTGILFVIFDSPFLGGLLIGVSITMGFYRGYLDNLIG